LYGYIKRFVVVGSWVGDPESVTEKTGFWDKHPGSATMVVNYLTDAEV
jgi:hypothetical protein